jgi:hypothetical protein
MKYKIENLNLGGAYIVKTSGKMTGSDYVAMAKDILKQDNWVPGNNGIFDHRELDFTEVDLSDLEKIRSFHVVNEQNIGNGKSAILVKSGLAEKWNMLWSHGEKIKTNNKTRLFESYEEAVEWITQKES